LVYIRKMLCRQPNDRVKEVSLRLFTDLATIREVVTKTTSARIKKILDQTYTER